MNTAVRTLCPTALFLIVEQSQQAVPEVLSGAVLLPCYESPPTDGRGTILWGHILPRATCVEHVEDTGEGLASDHPWGFSALAGRQQLLQSVAIACRLA